MEHFSYEYNQKENLVYVYFYADKYMEIQPKNEDECALLTFCSLGFIDEVSEVTRKNNAKQICIIDCNNSKFSLNDVNVKFAMYLVWEIHKHTKNEIYLIRTEVINAPAVALSLFNFIKPMLPKFVQESIAFNAIN